ncbi:L-arabinose transport system permease protein AraP [Planctomycetota bacterium]|nr:L-arabinose transport system permease protein AraP [Planctomycetota bacterium]
MKAGSRSSQLIPWLMVAPFVVLFTVFILYPLLRSLALSAYRSAGPANSAFIGGENYQFLLSDPLFWTACLNTATYAVLFVGLQLPAALGLAIALDHPRLRAKQVLRAAFFCPHLVGAVFLGVVFWKLMGKDPGSLANSLWLPLAGLFSAHPQPLNWLGDPNLALGVVVVAALWLSVGYSMIYLLAALQTVDRELYEAAAIDGAGPWARFRHITLPGVAPTLLFLLLVNTIGALQVFELPYVLTGGPGPANSTLTVVGYLYQQGFETGNLGYACAIGWALTIGIMAVSIAQLRVTRLDRDST